VQSFDPAKEPEKMWKDYLFLRTDDSTDAIGLRIFDNSESLAPLIWYATQNFQSKGSPSNLLVDGYEAIKDGRSVYVSAANLSGSQLFTNIYLISYNENASEATKEIYNRLLKSWEFNINPEITDHHLCADGQTYCDKDSDCPDKTCDTMKTKLVRDTKRITDLGALKKNLQIFYEASNVDPALKHFPQLLAGSYEIGHTTSKWPSWTSAFASELGVSAPLDPLNGFQLPCKTDSVLNAKYDQESCWNESQKDFVCPEGSHIYEYQASLDGTGFSIYANMEYEGDVKWINGSYRGCQNFKMTQ